MGFVELIFDEVSDSQQGAGATLDWILFDNSKLI
jgi:hypothetical protein